MINRLIIPFSIFVFWGYSCTNSEQNSNEIVKSEADSTDEKNTTNENLLPIPYHKEVTYKQIKFEINSPGDPTKNSFVIIPSGLSVVNDTIRENIDGKVKDLIIDDIDGDDAPEVAVITTNGAEEKGTVYVYSSNKGKSLSMVNLEDISGRENIYQGYRGRDEYNFVEGTFVRRFPIYSGDSLTGKMRQLQFKLRPGEAMKQLVLDKTIEF